MFSLSRKRRPITFKLSRFAFHCSACLISLSAFTLLAAQTTNDLRIADVRFSEQHPQFGGDRWLAMEVRVEVRGTSNPSAVNPDFIDQIAMKVAFAHNLGDQANPNLEYFWTRVEVPTLERGAHWFRFYLPPEQIERGRMNGGEPYAWFVRIDLGHVSQDPAAPNQTVWAVSGNLRAMPRLERFQELLKEQEEQRAGILLPQVETPFRDMYLEETPFIKGSDRHEKGSNVEF